MAAQYGFSQSGFSGSPGRDRSRSPRQGGPGASTEEIQKLIVMREQARLSKDWGQADSLRDRLKSIGVTLQDKTNSWTCMDGRTGQIPTFNDIQALSSAPPQASPTPQMPGMAPMGGMPMGGMQPEMMPPMQGMPGGMPDMSVPPTGDMQQQQHLSPPPGMGMAPGMGGMHSADGMGAANMMGGMQNMMMHGMSMPGAAVPAMASAADGQVAVAPQLGANDGQLQLAAAMTATAPAATDPAAAAAAMGMAVMSMPTADNGAAGQVPGATPDMQQQYAMMGYGTDPAQMAQMQQLQQYQQQYLQMQQMQQMQLLQQQALAAMAMPGGMAGGMAGAIPGMGVGQVTATALPTAKSASPDVQTALGIMAQVKAAGRAPSDAELNWLVEAREKVRKAKDWTGGDELRAAMKNYFGVEFFEKEKRWKSSDGREGLIPMWSSLP